MFLTSLKQTCNEYLVKFYENQTAPKLENRKTSPCSPHAPNLLHVLPSRMVGWHKLCNPANVTHPWSVPTKKRKRAYDSFSNEFVNGQQLWLDQSYFSFCWYCIKLLNVGTISHCRTCRWHLGMEAKPWGCCLGWDLFKRE